MSINLQRPTSCVTFSCFLVFFRSRVLTIIQPYPLPPTTLNDKKICNIHMSRYRNHSALPGPGIKRVCGPIQMDVSVTGCNIAGVLLRFCRYSERAPYYGQHIHIIPAEAVRFPSLSCCDFMPSTSALRLTFPLSFIRKPATAKSVKQRYGMTRRNCVGAYSVPTA